MINTLKTLDHKDILVRAAKTALAAVLATLTTTHLSYNKQGLVALGSAVVTALLNYALQLTRS